ncbi:MAG: 3-hydroxyacyl-CoA dehydrogenase NAD-binding domain-containing protein, partial [Bacteroidota bacterium]
MTLNGGLVSVIGAGTMGNGIAHVFAQHGFKVTL